MDFTLARCECEQLHARADQFADAARHLTHLNPTSRLSAPEAASDVLAALASPQRYVLSCAGDVNETAALEPDQARVHHRAVLSDALLAPAIARTRPFTEPSRGTTGDPVRRRDQSAPGSCPTAWALTVAVTFAPG